MRSISVRTENCDQEHHFLINELATASVTLELHFDQIVSVQSQRDRKRELVALIQSELSKFTWLIAGSVQIEFAWYLHSVDRQETDKVGDIDNITKPILDALAGENGLLIDDSQIGSIHTFWMSRNEQLSYSVLKLKIEFNNDDCLQKKNLLFIQYSNAVCLALNVDLNEARDVFFALIFIRARKMQRSAANKIRGLGGYADHFLIASTWEFHKTRLVGFRPESQFTLSRFKEKICENGFSFGILSRMYRSFKSRKT